MAQQKVGLVYSRSSRDDGDETFSIDSQTKRNVEYAQRHHIDVPEENILSDEYTGFTLDRPAFNWVMRLIQEGRVDSIIVYKVNRIARKSHLADYFLQEIVFPNKVELHIVEWGRAVRNHKDDLLLFGLQAQFSQFDAMDIKERTVRGRREKVEQGIWLGQGQPVYGYSQEGARKNTRLFIVEDEAKVVRLIYILYVQERLSLTEIARFLTAEGHPSPSELRNRWWHTGPWRRERVRNILRDERYIGHFYAFKETRVGGHVVQRPKEEWVKQEFLDLAIVDKETWYLAQQILDQTRNRWPLQPTQEYLLLNRQTCLCGGPISSRYEKNSQGKKYPLYKCSHRVHHKNKDCIMPSVRVRVADVLIWQKLEALLRNPDWALDLLFQAQARQKAEHGDAVAQLKSIEDIRNRYEAELEKRYQDYQDGLLSKALLKKEKERLDQRLEAAEEVYREYQEKLNQRVLSDGEITRIGKKLRTIADILDRMGNVEFEEKRALVELMNVWAIYRVDEVAQMLMLDLYIYAIDFDTVEIEPLQLTRTS